MPKDSWFVIPSALMTDAEKKWFGTIQGVDLDEMAEAGIRIADDGIYIEDLNKARDHLEWYATISDHIHEPPSSILTVENERVVGGKILDRSMESISGPPKAPFGQDLLGFQTNPDIPFDELPDDELFSMDDPSIKGSPGARRDDPEVRKTRTEWNKQLLEEGKLKKIGKKDLAQIDALVEMRRNLGLNVGGGADEGIDFIHQMRGEFLRVWGEFPEEFVTDGPDGISQADMDAWAEKMRRHGESEYRHLSPESQRARADWGYGQPPEPGDVRQFPTEERQRQVQQDRTTKLSKEAQEAQAKYQEEFRKAIVEMKQPALGTGKGFGAAVKGGLKKLATVGAKLGGVGTAVDLIWPSKLEGDPYKSSESATGIPKGWTGKEWRERQARDVEGAEWLSQQPGYGDTPPWANVPPRPRDPEAYEMLAPGQQKQEDRLSAAEEAVRMDDIKKRERDNNAR